MDRRSLLTIFLTLGASMVLPVAARVRYSFRVFQSKCTGCKDCTRICPVDAIQFTRKKAYIDTEICTGCMLCYSTCTYGAIVKCLPDQDETR